METLWFAWFYIFNTNKVKEHINSMPFCSNNDDTPPALSTFQSFTIRRPAYFKYFENVNGRFLRL